MQKTILKSYYKKLLVAAFLLQLCLIVVSTSHAAAVDSTTIPPEPSQSAQASVDSGSAPDINNWLCAGVNLNVNTDCNTGGITDQEVTIKINNLISSIVNLFSVVVGIVAVIMIMVGGFRYITSGGDSGGVSGAKNTILYAIVGLIIVALAQVIVRFVLNRVTQ